jgi:TolA-binding protein
MKIYRLVQASIICIVLISNALIAQQSIYFTQQDRLYEEALNLFDKEKFSAAQEKFRQFEELVTDPRDELRINSEFYQGICALYLFHKDAEYELEKFVADHPDSRWVERAYLELATYNFKRKRYGKALEWFALVDPLSLSDKERIAFYYRRGQSRLEQEDKAGAKADFYEVKDKDSEFRKAALYYYSHLAYEENNHQTALDGFVELASDPGFSPLVPYYITHIYYKQGRYDELLNYAQPLLDQGQVGATKRIPEIARLVGDAYYRKEDFTKALNYLKIYHDGSDKADISRADFYQYGFTLYRTADYKGALESFNEASKEKDELAQSAVYHMGDCYLKLDQKPYARSAFGEASAMDFNRTVKEDALFNYAKLSYELSYNPFHEAIIAFEDYLKAYPDSPRRDEAYNFLLDVYLKTRNYEEALRSLDKIQKKDARAQEAYQLVSFNRGVELFQSGKYDDATQYFDRVKTYPVSNILIAEAIYWKAEIAYKQGRYSEATGLFNQFLAEPGAFTSGYYEDANYSAGYALFKQKKYVSASSSFRKFIDSQKAEPRKKNDALLRLADCYYVNKEYDKAIQFYEQSIALGLALNDYAMYQKAMCQGLKGNAEQEISGLKKLIQDEPDSRYLVDARFQLAKAYLTSDRLDEARDQYLLILKNHGTSVYVGKSLLDLCLIYRKQGNNSDALETFDKIAERYPNEKLLQDALGIMRSLLLEERGPDYLANLAEKHQILDISKADLDEEVFITAADHYFRRDCGKAIPALEDYLRKFNPPLRYTEANYYIAECYFKQENMDKALDYYNVVTAQPASEFTEGSLVGAATIRYNRKEYEGALNHYRELEGVALQKTNILEAQIGQMRCYAKLGQNQRALDFANLVIADAATPESIRSEARLMRAKLLMDSGNLDDAYRDFAELAKSSGVRAAEAKYLMAMIAFKKQAWKPAEKELFELIQNFSAFNEFKYKGFLLLSDVYVGMGDYFQARTTLNTILSNVSEPWVIDEARSKLSALDDLENPAKNSGSSEEEIEINPNEGNDE